MPFGYLIRIRGAPLYVLLLRSTERVQVVELSAGENVVVGPLAIFFLRRSVDFLWFVDMLAPLYRQAPLAPQSYTIAMLVEQLKNWRCVSGPRPRGVAGRSFERAYASLSHVTATVTPH
tara:strand:- start:105 stop:461 length:357 start_codon:yes stop_codon:yes gene_type:complete